MTNTIQLSGWIKRLDNGTETAREAISESVTFTEYVEHSIILASEAADQAINFGGVTNAQLIIIKPTTDKPVTITLNADDLAIPVNQYMLLTGNDTQKITAMTMTNTVDSVNTVEIKIYG